MRVALVHHFSGPDASGAADEAVLDQAAALGRAGHEVRLVTTRADGPRHPARPAARRAVTPVSGHGRDPLPALRAFAPDVVHVHDLPSGAGRSWTAEWTRPLVTTLHDHRPLCGAAAPSADGAPCPCVDGERRTGLWHAPHLGARLATLPRAWAAARGGVRRDPLLRRADRVIVLSDLSRETYERAGLPAERLTVVPHFVPVADDVVSMGGDAFVVVARLAPEENVLGLLRHWPAGRRLDVVGTGPLEHACRAAAPASVRFLGALGRPALRRLLPACRGLVHPGPWAAGAVPAVYPQALAAGLPVLAFEGSAAPRAVRADGTGTVAAWDAPLAPALDAAARLFPTLRAHCRGVCAKRYGEQVWVERMEQLYTSLT
ncbi:glycosyltransferase family 4 protein [Streptomyces sp. NPDC006552]|uniref:glycosyltransferase family 4 protein n=1 Tax=Streptomyces sp. NPDC006552 TaxID=3157179 RepID=UPI0033B7C44C